MTEAIRMKPVGAILAAALVVFLAGCTAHAKNPLPVAAPAVPTPPPQPLSIPQTSVDLPRQQPLDPGALTTATPPPAAPPQAAPQPAVKTPQAPPRRSNAAPPKPETTAPAPVEAARPHIQEIIPPDEQIRLRHDAQEYRRLATQLANEAQRRGLTPTQQSLVTQINQIVKSSSEAEKKGELRSANDLAGRALTLAKELQSGK
jgi:hypothetical protein